MRLSCSCPPSHFVCTCRANSSISQKQVISSCFVCIWDTRVTVVGVMGIWVICHCFSKMLIMANSSVPLLCQERLLLAWSFFFIKLWVWVWFTIHESKLQMNGQARYIISCYRRCDIVLEPRGSCSVIFFLGIESVAHVVSMVQLFTPFLAVGYVQRWQYTGWDMECATSNI